MEILNARLKGFIGFKKGMGLDEVSVDMSGISGLVALAGPNGKGKTTLLENLQPFREIASRKGALYNHVFLRDSEKDLAFRFHGDEYRTLIKIDAQSARQEGFIWKNGTSEVNGKVSEYDNYITRLLGSSSLFFNSVFCAQNSAKISDLRTGELKALFSEFLRLDRYIAWEDAAKQAGNYLFAQHKSVCSDIETLEKTLSGLNECSEQLKVECEKMADSQKQIKDKTELLEQKESELISAKEAAGKNAALIEQLDELLKQKPDLEKILQGIEEQSARELTRYREKAREFSDGIKASETLLAAKDRVLKAGEQKQQFENLLKSKRVLLSSAQTDLASFNKKVSECSSFYRSIQDDIKDLKNDAEIRRLKTEITLFESKAVNLKMRDPECKIETCSFIVDALDAQEKLPGLKDRLKAREEKADSLIEEKFASSIEAKRELEQAEKALSGVTDTISSLNKEIGAIEKEIEGLTALADQLSKIEAAEARLADLRKQKDEIISEGIAAKNRWDDSRTSALDRINAHGNQIKSAEKQINHEVETKTQAITAEIKSIKEDLAVMDCDREKILKTIHSLETQVREKDVAVLKLSDLKARQSKLSIEISEWAYLRDACGKNGLQALEIDSVAPVITGYANEYTLSAFGPNSAIKIRTIDDEGKECFDILIIDEDGEEVALGNRSGGQKVWPLKALRLAMSSINRDKSGRDFKTIFADEEDGALDADKAISFVKLYRAFIQQSDFKTCLYISHKAECVNMADHVINFNGCGITAD